MSSNIYIDDTRIQIIGHAGAGPPGEDIVCAAISALLQTFVASVDELTNDHLKRDLRSGMAVIEYKYEDLSEQTKLLIESFFIGVSGVAGASPENVTVIDGRRGTEAPGGADKATESSGEQGGKHEQDDQRHAQVQVPAADVRRGR